MEDINTYIKHRDILYAIYRNQEVEIKFNSTIKKLPVYRKGKVRMLDITLYTQYLRRTSDKGCKTKARKEKD